jgi:hypothetical protein
LHVAAAGVTVVGTVTDNYQIVPDEGVVCDVAESDTGDEAMLHLGKKVELKASIDGEYGDIQILTVASYIIIDED